MDQEHNPDVLTLRAADLAFGGRFLVIGDIHGQLEMLQRALAAAGYDESRDVLIGVGDLIDRGPHSVEVVKFFNDSPRRYCTMGNHDAFLLEANGTPTDAHFWGSNRGDWAFWAEKSDLQLCQHFLSRLPIAIELILDCPASRIGIVHAEVPMGSTWDDAYDLRVNRGSLQKIFSTPAAEWFRGRERIRSAALIQDFLDAPEESVPFKPEETVTPGIDLVISGHSIVRPRRPFRFGNQLWIDTGAFEFKIGGRLTIVDPISNLYWQAGQHEVFGPLNLQDEQLWRLK